jgi:rRNA-processing protein Efg1
MALDHKLDLSGYQPPTQSTCRPDKNGSTSPNRRLGDSEQGGSTPHTGNGVNAEEKKCSKKRQRELPSHRSRETNATNRHPKSRKRRKGQNDGTETKGLSDRIHSLRRLLAKAKDMPADIRQEKERELQGYVTDQQRSQAKREKNALVSRYHFVRFMERKKASRHLKQLEKKFEITMTGSETADPPHTKEGSGGGPSEEDEAQMQLDETADPGLPSSAEKLAQQREQIRRRLHEAKVDLNYTLYAPLDQKYISLYPTNAKGPKARDLEVKDRHDHSPMIDDDQAGITRNETGVKPLLWYEIEKAMTNDTLEALRDGKILRTANTTDAKDQKGMVPREGQRRPAPEPTLDDAEDGKSEDDFFER